MRSAAPVLKPKVEPLREGGSYYQGGMYVPSWDLRCHSCSESATARVTFYRRNPRNYLVMRPYRQYRCDKHTPKEV